MVTHRVMIMVNQDGTCWITSTTALIAISAKKVPAGLQAGMNNNVTQEQIDAITKTWRAKTRTARKNARREGKHA